MITLYLLLVVVIGFGWLPRLLRVVCLFVNSVVIGFLIGVFVCGFACYMFVL